MKSFSVEVDIYLTDIWDQISDEEFIREMADRDIEPDEPFPNQREQLEKIWLEFRDKDCPQCLADYLWNTIGKAV